MNHFPLPVFPLNTPLLPGCQMPLQIFEQRYLDMVSHCMRNNSGFAVALLQPGAERHEVITPSSTPSSYTLPFYTVGTEARIVDFGQRENGLLSITIEGKHRVNLSGIHQDKSGLWIATAEPRPESTGTIEYNLDDWTELLEELLVFNGLQSMRAVADPQSSEQVINYLIMLLPLSAKIKQDLLETDQLTLRRQKLGTLIELLAMPDSSHPNL